MSNKTQTPPPHDYHTQAPYGPHGGSPYNLDQEDEDGISIKPILGFLQRHYRTAILAAILGLLGGYYWLTITTPKYTSVAKIEMAVRRPRIMNQEGALADSGRGHNSEEKDINTRLAKLKGRGAQRRLLADLKEWGITHVDDMPSVVVRAHRESRLFSIICTDTDPERAAFTANRMAELAELLTFEENKNLSDNSVRWIKEQVVSQRQLLIGMDTKLAEHRSKYSVDSLTGRKAAIDITISQLSQKKAGLEAQVVMEREIHAALKSPGNDFSAAVALPANIAISAELATKIKAWQQAEANLNKLLIRYRGKHPKLVAARLLIEARQNEVVATSQRAAASSASTITLLDSQLNKLTEQIERRRNESTIIGEKISKADTLQAGLERERQAGDITYQGLLRRMEGARLSADDNTATVKIIEAALPPSHPSWPRPPRIYAIALVLSLILAGGFCLLLDLVGNKIQTAEDIEAGLNLDIIGILPEARRSDRDHLATDCLHDRTKMMTESFATIRAVLTSPQYTDTSHTLVITSTIPAEGKTITACNLAACLARGGKKTLLVDMDLRRPRLAAVFNIDTGERSLAHTLENRQSTSSDFTDLITVTEASSNLHIIATRADRKLHPADIIASPSMATFIKWASDNYDQVILDTPPLGLLSDAGILAKYASGALLVTRAGVSRKSAVKRTVRHFTDTGGNLIGTVVNAVPLRHRGYSAHYYHQSFYASRYATEEQGG